MTTHEHKTTSTLSTAKRALLEQRLHRARSGVTAARQIARRPAGSVASLSFAQERLWFLDQLEPDSPIYNIQESFHLRGELNVAVLERSFQTIVARHETLRTSFAEQNEQPVQVIAPAVAFTLALVDLQHVASDQRQDQLHALVRAEGLRPFDLSVAPLLRATLYQVDSNEWVLALVLHHIIADGWSMGVLFAEVTALYQSTLTNQPSPLAELPIQYADYAIWQRDQLQGAVLDAEIGFWREQLAGAPALLELPTDRPRPARQTFRGATHSFALSPELSGATTRLAQDEGATLFMVLLAAWQTLLQRWSGQDDIVVGTPIAGRTQTETEGLIGLFVNTLALRSDLGGQPSFRALLQRVRATTLNAYEHQALPFERVVEALQPQRSLSYSPLFQVTFALQNAPWQPPQFPDVAVELGVLFEETTKFDLGLTLFQGADGLEASLQYNADLFDAATIARLAGHFQMLLAGAVAAPDTVITALPLLHEAERTELLQQWNTTPAPAYPQQTLATLFAAQAARTPDAVALETADGATLRYADLDVQANQLAHVLQELGVGPEVTVAVCLDRSIALVVALLAVLKAGGAYVPLDPSYPEARLRFLLDDAACTVLLTTAALQPALPPVPHTVCLDRDAAHIAAQPTTPPPGASTPDQLAYVLYTSGSTGTPKGVAVTHANVVRLVHGSVVPVTPDLIGLLFAPITFDASTLELWLPLLHGARLVLAPPPPLGLAELAALITRCQVSLLWLTAGLFHQMVEHHPDTLQGVRYLLAGGDVLSPTHVRALLPTQPGHLSLINGYGPTENTVFTCCHELRSASEVGQRVPIGRPIAYTTVYVLDRQGQPVPIGVPGELYTGGAGVARGYWQRPDLTVGRFVPDPWSVQPGARLYRTGDRVCWLPDGTLAFLGRLDHQVKLRGFRIELGEIEAVLRQHAAVREAVALVREDTPGHQQLVAYVVGDDVEADAAALPVTLQEWLRERLPSYMVPTTVVVLERFPVTRNGKLDRTALPAPTWADATTYVAPRTPLEQELVQIWQAVLPVTQLGVTDNFFALGGHSLLATRVIARIRAKWQLHIPLRSIFDGPTIAELAIAIENQQPSQSTVQPTAMTRVNRAAYRAQRSTLPVDDSKSFAKR